MVRSSPKPENLNLKLSTQGPPPPRAPLPLHLGEADISSVSWMLEYDHAWVLGFQGLGFRV